MAKSIRKILKTFTLVELVIVIAIIAVLGSVAFLILSKWIGNSKDVKKISDLTTIEKSINLSLLNNSKLPTPDDYVDVVFSGNKIWELGYFGINAIEQAGGTITKLPIDPSTKERYKYAQWNNNKFQLGTIVENVDYSNILKRSYAREYYNRVHGSYDQTIIVAKIDGFDNVLPIPSLLIDQIDGPILELDENKFWISKKKYNSIDSTSDIIKVQSLYSGNINDLKESEKFNIFKVNYQNAYSGLQDFVIPLNDGNIDSILLEEINKVISLPLNMEQLSCNGISSGNSKTFYSSSSVDYGQTCLSFAKEFVCSNGDWMDGDSIADIQTYKYSGCITGTPIGCSESSIIQKSATNLDMTFEIPFTNHGESFEQSTTIDENNGIYEYTLVGSCNNGTLENLSLSESVNISCNPGYNQEGNACVPQNCEPTSQTVNGHIYSLGPINHGVSSTVTSNAITIANGEITYSNLFLCNLGIITASGTETTNTPTCNSGYIVYNNQCVPDIQWTGNSTDGFTYVVEGVTIYPNSCNDLIVSTDPDFKLGIGTPFNGANFADGYYYIDLDGTGSLPALKAYCDMNTDGGGRTRISYNQTTSFTTARYSSCKNNGYHFITNFECISPVYFTNIRFKRSGYTDVFVAASKAQYRTEPTRYGWQFSPVTGSRYTMRDYNHATLGFNTGRWGTSHGKFQNDINVWGK
ncbi:MAG: type II secretion system protein [Candidatus Absconditabacteria bacterium]